MSVGGGRDDTGAPRSPLSADGDSVQREGDHLVFVNCDL
jgi:hypothetical protein